MSDRKTQPAPRSGILLAFWFCLIAVCLGAVFPGTACHAQAGSNPWTIQQTAPSLSNPNTYALWVKKGTTDSSGNYSGDTASIWTMDAGGNQVKISPTYGPYAGWRATELTSAFDGTLRMAWTMRSGRLASGFRSVLSVWTLDVYANRTAVSPTYGPFPGWQFYEMFPNPDGTSSLYWTKLASDSNSTVNGTLLSIWRVDSVGSQLSISPTYGPYAGWYFLEGVPSFNKDGSSFLVWVNDGDYDANSNYSGDQISVWKTDVQGNRTSVGPTYGRYPGWQFSELYPAYDGTARLLWTLPGTTDNNNNYTGDTASVWSMDAAGQQTTISPTYGPFPGWTVYSVNASLSSTSRLLWVLPGTTDANGSYSGDSLSLWSLNAADVQTSISPTYTLAGAGSGGLSIMADGSERLEWDLGNSAASNYSDTQLSLWSLDASNNRTATGPIYGPFF